MNLLQMVQKAIRKSGAKVDEPSTIVGAEGLTKLFVEWVQDAWKEIQLERLGWDWRVVRDQTLTLSASTDEYTMPSTLEGMNLRTLSVSNATTTEVLLDYTPYDQWRRAKDVNLIGRGEGRPCQFTITPDNKLAFYPVPDAEYTLRYDGVLKIEELDDTDDTSTPTNLAAEYHDAIIWVAIMHYAQHFEDGSKLAEAQDRFRPYKKYFEHRNMPDVSIDTGAMYRRYYF